MSSGRAAEMDDIGSAFLRTAVRLCGELSCRRVFAFFSDEEAAEACLEGAADPLIVPVLPRGSALPGALACWAGNQSRFSRIKYAYMQGVRSGIIAPEDR